MNDTLIHRFDHVDSTLNVLAERFSDAPNFTTVLAQHQSHGRGRSGRKWSDEKGQSLLLATLVRVSHENLSWVTPIAGMAIHDALDAIGVHTRLKWPNDIIAKLHKIGGILCEHLKTDISGRHVIAVGVGVNLGHIPIDAGPQAASVNISTEALETVQEQLTHLFLRALDRYLEWDDPKRWHERYRELLGDLGQSTSVHLASGEHLTLVAWDVNERGTLIGYDHSGRHIRIEAADVDLPGWPSDAHTMPQTTFSSR